jgi:hypothetical protein
MISAISNKSLDIFEQIVSTLEEYDEKTRPLQDKDSI